MKAIILAGGEGTRLRPLTQTTPKPMIPIMDRPIMEHIINLLAKHSITDIGVTLHYLPNSITNYFGDGRKFGVKIKYFLEEQPLGTAGSVKNAESFLTEDFIVISGDALTDFDLTSAIEAHYAHKKVATILLTQAENPLDYGVVIVNRQGLVEQFMEKPTWSEVFSDYVNTGIYIFSPSILSTIPKNEKYDFSKNLFPLLLKNGIYGHICNDYWCDIGDLEAYKQCQFDILDNKINLNCKTVGKSVRVEAGATVTQPVYLGDNVTIKKGANIMPYTIIGNNSTICGTTANSVIHENSNVLKGATIIGSITCKNAVIGENSVLTEGCAVGDGTIIEENCTVEKGAKIWANKIVKRGTTLQNNLVWGDYCSSKLFYQNQITGYLNITITPAFMSKLGGVCGHILGGNIMVTAPKTAVGNMLKSALMSGLNSTGSSIFDCGDLPLCALRQGIIFYQASGGVNISVEDNKVYVTVLNKYGAELESFLEREAENLFMRNDFPLAQFEDIKAIKPIYYKEFYIFKLKNHCSDRHKFNIIPTCKYDIVDDIFNKNQENSQGICSFYLNNNYEIHHIIDEVGNTVSQEDLLMIICKILVEKGVKKIVVPVGLSDNFTRLGVKVIWSKRGNNFVANTLAQEGLSMQFKLMFDGLHSVIAIMNYCGNTPLYKIVEKLPNSFIYRKEILCDHRKKGEFMKILLKQQSAENATEGVKISAKNGWVLAIPDADTDSCSLFAEATSTEFAEEMCAFVENLAEF